MCPFPVQSYPFCTWHCVESTKCNLDSSNVYIMFHVMVVGDGLNKKSHIKGLASLGWVSFWTTDAPHSFPDGNRSTTQIRDWRTYTVSSCGIKERKTILNYAIFTNCLSNIVPRGKRPPPHTLRKTVVKHCGNVIGYSLNPILGLVPQQN